MQTVNVADGVQTGNQPTERLRLFGLIFAPLVSSIRRTVVRGTMSVGVAVVCLAVHH